MDDGSRPLRTHCMYISRHRSLRVFRKSHAKPHRPIPSTATPLNNAYKKKIFLKYVKIKYNGVLIILNSFKVSNQCASQELFFVVQMRFSEDTWAMAEKGLKKR